MAEIKSDYLDNNDDIRRFVDAVSDSTGERNMSTWMEHLRNNRGLFKLKGWAADALQGKEKDKTAIIIGASPALADQLDTLKELQFDSKFVLCGISSNLGYLLNNGITPNYCIVMDADKSTGDDWNSIDMAKARNITLIANTYAYPPMLKRWQGPLYFVDLETSDKKFKSKKKKWYGASNGIGRGFPSILCQFNIMAALAYLMLECPIIILIGHELSFQAQDSKYYVDRKDDRDHESRYPHGDINLEKVHTTTGLLSLKYALEAFLELLSGHGWFFNCTEAGIFGISKKFPWPHRVPWIEQLTLIMGIAQARHIMRTGQPFYE